MTSEERKLRHHASLGVNVERWAVQEIDRLRAIVDRLPTWGDGTPCVPQTSPPDTYDGWCVYLDEEDIDEIPRISRCAMVFGEEWGIEVEESGAEGCEVLSTHGTREAAEEAKESEVSG